VKGGGERKPVIVDVTGYITFDLGLRHFYLETAIAGSHQKWEPGSRRRGFSFSYGTCTGTRYA
jgi:hypothetical protein